MSIFLSTKLYLASRTSHLYDDNVVDLRNSSRFKEPSTSAFVTFIIPSKGRDSIGQAVQSLFNQTSNTWKAVIIFDGKQINLTSTVSAYLSDPRITYYTIQKLASSNHAGTLRNYGMSRVECSEWFAFLDDDDVLAPEYVARLREEAEVSTLVQTVIFRMSVSNPHLPPILPPKNHDMFKRDRVGISFAIKRQLFESGLWFEPSQTEDFDLLKRIFESDYDMVISPYVMYYVRNVRPDNPRAEYPRVNVKKGF